jgi:hypothetical protein
VLVWSLSVVDKIVPGLKPKRSKLFNLYHAQLCNIIKQIFGVLKNEFKLAAEPSDYHIDIQ